jgi:hypothetical protein
VKKLVLIEPNPFSGAWAAMPEKRRAAFAAALPPNFYEWDAVMSEDTPLALWKSVPAQTLVVRDPKTRRPIREIVCADSP